jgi:hypothetical protein
MVNQRNPKRFANTVKPGGVDAEYVSGHPDGALERDVWGRQAADAATCLQNAAVEGSVMGRQEPNSAQPAIQLRPKLGEGRSVSHHIPGYAVKVREHKFAAWRPDQA